MRRYLTPQSTRIAANVATAAFAAAMLVQLLLAAGVIPSSMAWGGTQPVLTAQLRVASLVAAVILGLCAYLIRRRAGLAGSRPVSTPVKVLAWIVTGYMVFNTLANFASPSFVERAIFGPLTLLLAVACLLVALSNPNA
jgi:hypothetical protein